MTITNSNFDSEKYSTNKEYKIMADSLYVKCQSCGYEWYTDNEDDHVVQLCESCGDYGSDHQIERGEYDGYCDCEDYPCCGH